MEKEVDTDNLMELADAIKRLKMFPYFQIANYILLCTLVREDTYPPQIAGVKGFSRTHPLSSWFGSMMLCFGGGMMGNMLLGDPVVAPFKNEFDVIIATVIWYLINFSPLDLTYKVTRFSPVRFFLIGFQEVFRINNIYTAINFALLNFSGSYVLVCLFSTMKGSAALIMRFFQRLTCGVWMPASFEMLKPSVIVKMSFCASVGFILQHLALLQINDKLFYLCVLVFFCAVRFMNAMFAIDVFSLFERIVCYVIFGGLVDALPGSGRVSIEETIGLTEQNLEASKNPTNKAQKKKNE